MSNPIRPKASPTLPRLLLPVIGGIALLIVGSLLLLSLGPGAPSGPGGGPAASVTGPTLPSDPEGTALNVKTTLGQGTLELLTTFRTSTYQGQKAAEGSEFVVVTFSPVPGSGLATAEEALRTRLSSEGTEYGPTTVIVPSAQDAQTNGALGFIVPVGRTDLNLVIGTQSISLDLAP